MDGDSYITLAAGLIVAAILVTALLVTAAVMADSAAEPRLTGTAAQVDGLLPLRLAARLGA